MRRIIIWFSLVFASIGTTAHAQTPPATPSVEVMVLGTYHFHNPGLDRHNIDAESVLTPQRQQELDDLAATLATFRPTHVMVEMEAPAPDYQVPAFTQFTRRDLRQDPNEIVQIGFRLADRIGLAAVQGIDVQAREGEEDYFPMDRVRAAAAASGQSAILETGDADVAAWAKRFSASQRHRSIADLLMEMNGPHFPGGQQMYDRLIPIANGEDLAGAHLNARWYARNIRIFAKLAQITRPGDRVVVVYGAGHAAWLRHFARSMHGYSDVDVTPYLAKARDAHHAAP